jgi:hypothetical protein
MLPVTAAMSFAQLLRVLASPPELFEHEAANESDDRQADDRCEDQCNLAELAPHGGLGGAILTGAPRKQQLKRVTRHRRPLRSAARRGELAKVGVVLPRARAGDESLELVEDDPLDLGQSIGTGGDVVTNRSASSDSSALHQSQRLCPGTRRTYARRVGGMSAVASAAAGKTSAVASARIAAPRAILVAEPAVTPAASKLGRNLGPIRTSRAIAP